MIKTPKQQFESEIKDLPSNDIIRQSKVFLDKILEQAQSSIKETKFFLQIYNTYSKLTTEFSNGLQELITYTETNASIINRVSSQKPQQILTDALKSKEKTSRNTATVISKEVIEPLSQYLDKYIQFSTEMFENNIKLLRNLHTNKRSKMKIEEELFDVIEEIRQIESDMSQLNTDSEDYKQVKFKQEMHKFSTKLLKKKQRRAELEYNLTKSNMQLNPKWRKYNQEFYSAFNQFDIKDMMRKHQLMDSPTYFLKSDGDLNKWTEERYPDGLKMSDIETKGKSNAISQLSLGLSCLFNKEKIQEPAFCFEKMYMKKQQLKNQYLQEVKKKINEIQNHVDKLDILAIDKFLEGVVNDQYSSDFPQVVVRKNSVMRQRNVQSYILLKIQEEITINNRINCSKTGFNYLKTTYSKILKDNKDLRDEHLIMVANTALKICVNTTDDSLSNRSTTPNLKKTVSTPKTEKKSFNFKENETKQSSSKKRLSVSTNVSRPHTPRLSPRISTNSPRNVKPTIEYKFNKTKYLINFIQDERFENKDLWAKCLKIKEQQVILSSNTNGFKNFSWNLAKAIAKKTSMFQAVTNHADVQTAYGTLDKAKLISIIKEISQMLYGLNFSFEKSGIILLELCKQKDLATFDIETILIGYEKLMLKDQFDTTSSKSSQKKRKQDLNRFFMTPILVTSSKEIKQDKSNASDKKLTMIKNRDELVELLIGTTVPYLTKKDHFELLRVNRNIRKSTKDKILKYWVYNRKINIQNKIRLWKMFITYDEFGLKKMLAESILDKNLPKEAEIIDLDLSRTKSAQENPEVFNVLKIVQKNFSWKYRETTSYFQGQNFLCTFFYKNFDSAEDTQRILCSLNDTIFTNIFNKKNPKLLPLTFYTLDRLIEIQFPDIGDHFSRERISSDQYGSPFLITLFTIMHQQNEQNSTTYMFQDIIFTEKLIGVFKVFLGIMSIYKEKFLDMKFEEFIMFWADLPSKPEFVQSEKFTDLIDESEKALELAKEKKGSTIKESKETMDTELSSEEIEIGKKMRNFYNIMDTICIDQGTLDGLRAEYDHVKQSANSFWNKFYTGKIN